MSDKKCGKCGHKIDIDKFLKSNTSSCPKCKTELDVNLNPVFDSNQFEYTPNW